MTRNITSLIGSASIATIVLGALFILPSAAMAQASPASAPAAVTTPANNPVEERIATLHDQLQITAAEEPLWQAVAKVMRGNAETTGALIEEREAKARKKALTAINDMHSYEAIANAHAAGVKKLATVFETLYASMPDAQKKNADSVFNHRP